MNELVDCNVITIGNNVLIASNVQLYTAVLPGVTIGDGSVIGAGSVVTKDTENSLAVGNPCRVIQKINSDK